MSNTLRCIFIMMIGLNQLAGCSESNNDASDQVSPPPSPNLTVDDQLPTRPEARTDRQITDTTEIEGDMPVQRMDPAEREEPEDLPEIDADEPAAPPPVADENNIPRSETRPGLAVIPFKLQGRAAQRLDASDGSSIATIVLSEIASDRYRLFERQQLEAILREKDFVGRTEFASDTDAIRAGRIAGIRFLVVGEVIQLGSEYTLTARLVDCLNGEIGQRGSVTFATMDQIRGKLPELIHKLGLSDQHAGITRDRVDATPARPAPTGNELMDAVHPEPPFAVELTTADLRDGYVLNDTISFQVSAERDCFVTMLAMDAEGRVTQLLPNRINPGDVFLQRGQTVSFPPPGASYQFRVKDPPWGVTRVKVIATETPLRIPALLNAQGALPALGRIDGELMADAADQWKSISVVAVPGANEDGDRRMNPGQPGGHLTWSHAELEIVTAQTRAELDRRRRELGWLPEEEVVTKPEPKPEPEPVAPPRTQPPARSPPSQPTQPEYAGDANDAVYQRWIELREKLTRRGVKSTSFAQSAATTRQGTTVDRIFVVYRDGTAPETKDLDPLNKSLAAVNPAFRSVPVAPTQGRKSIIPTDIEAQIRALKTNPDVLIAIPDFPLFASNADPEILSVQWEKANPFRPGTDVSWPRELVGGIRPALVAVVDQGIDVTDRRLNAFAWTNPGEVAGNGIDDDGNGIVDDVHGFNPFLNSGDVAWSTVGGVQTPINHGSFCASIVAGRSVGHPLDLEGLAPTAEVLSAVALDRSGRGGTSALVAAIDYAVQNNAKVINLSLGGLFDGGTNPDGSRRPTRQDFENARAAFSQLWSRWDGALFVIAAGNDHNDNDEHPVFPASLGFSNIISVAAFDPDGRLARGLDPSSSQNQLVWRPYSNYGSQTVDIAAPGSLILGIPGLDDLGINDGTSFAAPMVTAAAALVWGQNPNATPEQIKQILMSTATPLPGLEGRVRSSGILNIRAALESQISQP